MYPIRNNQDKLVCCVDAIARVVEINIKGCKTVIQFLDNGKLVVTND